MRSVRGAVGDRIPYFIEYKPTLFPSLSIKEGRKLISFSFIPVCRYSNVRIHLDN
ncbi:hypothetical protein DYBT9275_01556 [Dyadobacter sp. CECT 9275]|uniref:Uncharacterized protein n=1 Tax=Dyadobacter helix TaxID=2822344 RepID=A0A916N3I7_9BACT|nr:hypothetical protein DYBT9275_01556 [Dyadobacter sp. CECT 9275]